jgi:hypothetical protein
MTTKATSSIKAYSIMARDFSDLDHHLGDVIARSAREAVRDARCEYGHRYRDFAAERIRLADIDDADLRAAMEDWMDWQGVEAR